MAWCKSSTRLPKDLVFLAQSDTTVGFGSQSRLRLDLIKSRSSGKHYITAITSLALAPRVPQKYKNLVRRSKKITFVVNGRSFRLTHLTPTSAYLRGFAWYYTTSANRSTESFDREFCFANADLIVEDSRGLKESRSSSIIKLGTRRLKKLR